MGWWWSKSPSPQKEESQLNPSLPTPAPESLPQSPPQPRTLSREEQADLEFKQLLASLESDINRSSSSESQPSSSTSSADSIPSDSPTSIAPESLYPDTMSCRSAFDYAFFCQSLGGQFVNVYRYGELRSCSEHWDNFWMCMKTRGFSEKERKRLIRDHYRKKAIKYKTGPSSEDVWDVRTEPVGNAFQGDFAALEREMKAEEEAEAKAKATAQTASVV